MSAYRKGDVSIQIEGVAYILRLTLGALAEIDHRLGVKGPLELAEKLKGFSADQQSAEDALILLECLLRPAFPSLSRAGAVNIPALVKCADPNMFMPKIASLFEMNFKGGDDG